VDPRRTRDHESVFTKHTTLSLSTGQAADIATWYLIGQVIGALFFGRLSDTLGRKRLFTITLGVYLLGSGLTAVTATGSGWVIFLYATRVLAGAGIGGEYAAINSAIDEMMPARYRGRMDIAINGTYWGGALIGTAATLFVLNKLAPDTGWRLAYLLGPVLGLVIIWVRRTLPESPRWLIMHGREAEAEANIAEIEREVEANKGPQPEVGDDQAIDIRPTERLSYFALVRVLFSSYPGRSTLTAVLMATQSFLYNAIFFTYALVLSDFFNVSSGDTGYYYFAFAAGNLLGPLLIGHLFDTLGRKTMISGTYILSGVLLVISAILFKNGDLNATTQTIAWTIIFFFASAGASAAYLTASELFPLEVRSQAIAVFFAIAQLFGSFGSHLYGHLIGNGPKYNPNDLFWGYILGAGLMILGGLVALVLAVDAEGRSLEDLAAPLSMVKKAVKASTTPPPRAQTAG
jgi:MFS family permease